MTRQKCHQDKDLQHVLHDIEVMAILRGATDDVGAIPHVPVELLGLALLGMWNRKFDGNFFEMPRCPRLQMYSDDMYIIIVVYIYI